ncbi:MAG TPA: hypothetical protein VFO82_11905 [Steroidobacteraceae bacterium]|nr:hypothetical protein [Steroidobacteraceae bacterium]
MKLNLKTALGLTALALLATSAHAVLPHEVTCANGKTVLVPDSATDWEACLTIGSYPANSSKPTSRRISDVTMKRGVTGSQDGSKYRALAAKYKPRTPEMQKLVEQYMKLPPSRRNSFKADNPAVPAAIWDYAPYAVCFYASVAGGADVVEAGEECHADWVE